MKKNKFSGESLDNFLKEEGLYEEVTARALKKASMYKLKMLIASKRGMKNKIRKELKSPSMVERLFSDNPKVEYETLIRAGLSVGLAPIITWVSVDKLPKKLKG